MKKWQKYQTDISYLYLEERPAKNDFFFLTSSWNTLPLYTLVRIFLSWLMFRIGYTKTKDYVRVIRNLNEKFIKIRATEYYTKVCLIRELK